MSRQAVVKHLTALAAAGLLVGERQGREVRYQVVGGPVSAGAATWLSEVGAMGPASGRPPAAVQGLIRSPRDGTATPWVAHPGVRPQ